MSTCHKMVIGEVKPQDYKHHSFIGGKPKVPANFEIPICSLCGEEQTFYFQVTFPSDHDLNGRSILLFYCTSCWHPEHLIPEMLTGNLKNAEVPESFLDHYQKNFRALTFNVDALVWLESYEPKLQYAPIELVSTTDIHYPGHKLGGSPNWYLEDESPRVTNSGKQFVFLMQFAAGLQFPKAPSAPGQMKKNYRTGQAAPSSADYYQLFLENNLYFFITSTNGEPKVYIITQI